MVHRDEYPVTGDGRRLGEALVRELDPQVDGLSAHETDRQIFKVNSHVDGKPIEMVQLRGEVAEFSSFQRKCEEAFAQRFGDEAIFIAKDLAELYFRSLIDLYSAANIKVRIEPTEKKYLTLKLATESKQGPRQPPASPLWQTVAKTSTADDTEHAGRDNLQFFGILRRMAQSIQDKATGGGTISTRPRDTPTTSATRETFSPKVTTSTSPTTACPWPSHAEVVKRLRRDDATERDHEDAVKDFLVLLGHLPENVRFQRGRIDVLVTDGSGRPYAVCEVKKSLRRKTDYDDAMRKGHDYARKVGAPLVIITDADRYEVYDLNCGISYEEQLQGSFEIIGWRVEYAAIVDLLRPDTA